MGWDVCVVVVFWVDDLVDTPELAFSELIELVRLFAKKEVESEREDDPEEVYSDTERPADWVSPTSLLPIPRFCFPVLLDVKTSQLSIKLSFPKIDYRVTSPDPLSPFPSPFLFPFPCAWASPSSTNVAARIFIISTNRIFSEKDCCI